MTDKGPITREQWHKWEPEAYEAGFAAGVEHARSWRPLTSDPAAFPANGQWVVVYAGEVGDYLEWEAYMARSNWTHWLPLPPPPKEG